jgi:hypothetical protein
VLSACLVFILSSMPLSGQTDYSWWNEKHNWDGYTNWKHYMVLSSDYMGPNALPVPDMRDATLPGVPYVDIGLEGHFSAGDHTVNAYTECYFPLYTNRAALQISYRPIEYYQTDTLTRDKRISREFDPTGWSSGDVYVHTFVQAIKDHAYLPDILLSANVKTASGANLEGARHTDTPGYWFDASIGKSIKLKNPLLKDLRFYVKGGLYVYQTYNSLHAQNDAFLYGGGLKLSLKQLDIHNQLTGYKGYFNQGDHPVVYRLILEGKNPKRLSYRLVFQQGIHDFAYTSLRLSMRISLNDHQKDYPSAMHPKSME